MHVTSFASDASLESMGMHGSCAVWQWQDSCFYQRERETTQFEGNLLNKMTIILNSMERLSDVNVIFKAQAAVI